MVNRRRGAAVAAVSALFMFALVFLREQPSAAQKPPSDPPPADPSAPRFVILPYLQFPTTNSIVIMWETNFEGTSVVEYGPSTTQLQKVESKKGTTLHEVKLTELPIETKYIYRVSSTTAEGTTVTSGFYQFQTAVRPDSAFSFAMIGDTQRNPVITRKISNLMFKRRPHFVVHNGDVVDAGGVKAQWVDDLFGPSSELYARAAVFPTIGNHEKNHPWYYKYFSLPNPEYYYEYTYGNAHFFSIDTNKKVDPSSEQYRWLDEALGRSRATWKFVYHHHPVWSSDENDYGDTWKTRDTKRGDGNARHLQSLYEKHRVDMVFNGHIHLYERSWPIRGDKVDAKNGVIHLTSGGGGGKLEDFDPIPSWFKSQVRVDFHYCYFSILGKKLEFRAFDQNDVLFDYLDIQK